MIYDCRADMHSRSGIVHIRITCPDTRCRLAMLHNNQPKQKIAAAMQSTNALHPVHALHSKTGSQTGSNSGLYIQEPRGTPAVMNEPMNERTNKQMNACMYGWTPD